MLKTKIKTHQLGITYNQPHFFILNKGKHSGKPAPAHWSNCFVFLADDEEERGFYYFIIQGLWELGFFRPHLIGSVVPYIRIGDLIDIVEETVNAVNAGNRTFDEVQSTLAQIEEMKNRLQTKINYLLTIRKSIFYKHLKG